MTFPGRCDRCGGPQAWTFDSEDQIWVSCLDDACIDVQLPLPLDGEPDVMVPGRLVVETPYGVGGKGVPEEGEPNGSVVEAETPPAGWLLDLWEGYDG